MNLKDLKIEAIHRPSPGGQSVGVFSPGVRVTHIPTGISATVECERSQMRNRSVAMAMVEYGLAELRWRDA